MPGPSTTKVHVQSWGKSQGKVAVVPSATEGAVVELNLWLADGTLLKAKDILNSSVIQQLQGRNGTVGVTAGTYGTNKKVAQITVNAIGNITSAIEVAISLSAITGVPSVTGSWAGNVAGKNLAIALAALGIITDSTTA